MEHTSLLQASSIRQTLSHKHNHISLLPKRQIGVVFLLLIFLHRSKGASSREGRGPLFFVWRAPLSEWDYDAAVAAGIFSQQQLNKLSASHRTLAVAVIAVHQCQQAS